FSLFIHDKLLRTRALLGCLTFANFSILWTSMAFLLAAPPFSYFFNGRGNTGDNHFLIAQIVGTIAHEGIIQTHHPYFLASQLNTI
ncbi:hypothetical protein ONQ62_26725, partial [Salmonella enterica subsp. enterica serovar Virginia]|nr:hypothetical protein [Salmonella enterica subsp. enterica serovar Virginia]